MAKCKIGSRVTFAIPAGTVRGVVRSAPYRRGGKTVVDVKPLAVMDLRFSARFKPTSREERKYPVAVPARRLQCGRR